ncbi:MAG: SWIM zinc finger family protein [Chitinophagaceae bacterium]|nr:SWIM zinc finger family protein [Anaerolineae bacterium]
MIPKNIKMLQAESKQLKVQWIDKHTLVVRSSSSNTANYIVTVEFGAKGEVNARCTCPWALHKGVACSHVMAALDHLASVKERKLSFWTSREEARRQKQKTFLLKGSKNEGVWITSRAG